jgi:hypothetical protein
MITNPSDFDGILARTVNAIEAKVSLRYGDSVNVSTDRYETMLQLRQLRRGQAKLYANGAKAARIVPEPRFHHLFVRRKA